MVHMVNFKKINMSYWEDSDMAFFYFVDTLLILGE